ncbi:MAG: ABC transporter substrate-binding protein [Acidimicrobiia bacterium]
MPPIPRRAFLLGGSAALLAAAGCGGGRDDGAASASSPVAASGTDDAPVTVEHRYGSTTIEAPPQRVFAAGYTDVDPVLALGAQPVGFIDWYGDYPKADIRDGLWPWAHGLGAGDIAVLPRPEDDVLDIEAIAALRPDLVVAQYSAMTEREYDTLSEIAAVVAQAPDFEDYQAPWDVTTERIGRALHRSARADELVAGVKERFAEARAAHPEFSGRTALLVDYAGGVIYARGPEEPHGKVLAELGFDYPADIEALIPSDTVLAELSLEQLELLDGVDVVLVGDFEGAGELQANPLYQALDVVAQGRVVPGVEPIEGALYWASVLSLPYAIERLVPMLAAAVDGDPSTPVPVP